MDEATYRKELRCHFLSKMKSAQEKNDATCRDVMNLKEDLNPPHGGVEDTDHTLYLGAEKINHNEQGPKYQVQKLLHEALNPQLHQSQSSNPELYQSQVHPSQLHHQEQFQPQELQLSEQIQKHQSQPDLRQVQKAEQLQQAPMQPQSSISDRYQGMFKRDSLSTVSEISDCSLTTPKTVVRKTVPQSNTKHSESYIEASKQILERCSCKNDHSHSQSSQQGMKLHNQGSHVSRQKEGPRTTIQHRDPLSKAKYQYNEFHRIFDTDSTTGKSVDRSVSSKSHRSSATVISKKSSQDLRKLVLSHCKLHETIDKTLKQMCSPFPEEKLELTDSHTQTHPVVNKQVSRCMRCRKNELRQTPIEAPNEISQQPAVSNNQNALAIGEVVTSKVVNPMIRRLQRMYLNNLRDEMSLMEDLERLPNKVNDVYKSILKNL